MNIFLFFSLFYLCTASLLIEEKIPSNHSKFGLIFDYKTSFMGSLVTALYYIPCFKKGLYDEYAKLSAGPTVENITKTSIEFITQCFENMILNIPEELTIERTNVEFQAVDLFWCRLFETLPENIQNLFTFNIKIEIEIFSNPNTTRQMFKERFCKSVPIENTLTSLTTSIDNRFSNFSYDQKFVKQLKLDFPIQIKSEILSNSQVLTFRLNRITQENPTDPFSFNSDNFYLEKEILLNSVTYVLVSRIEYEIETGRYSAITHDLSDSKTYLYDGSGFVTEVLEFHNVDTRSILLFYIPKPKFPDFEFSRNLRTEKTITGTKRKHDEIIDEELEVKWNRVYKPDYNRYPQYIENSLTIENYLKEKIQILPFELVDFHAKYVYKIYPLGSQQYSFKPGSDGKPNDTLEIILSCLASHSNAVMKLFEMVDNDTITDYKDIEYNLAAVIVKMLFGCKNISLENLIIALKKRLGKNFKFDINMKQKDSDLKKIIKSIIYVINDLLMGPPTMSTIRYGDLNSDDPVSVTHKGPAVPIKIEHLRPSGQALIKGVWMDSFEKPNIRKRTIYESNSEIFMIEVERWTKPTGYKFVFNSSDLELNSREYNCLGAVTLTDYAFCFKSIFIDSFNSNGAFRSLIPGNESKTELISEGNMKMFDRAIKKESVLLFFSKKSTEAPKTIYSKSIPNNLFKKVSSEYAQQLK